MVSSQPPVLNSLHFTEPPGRHAGGRRHVRRGRLLRGRRADEAPKAMTSSASPSSSTTMARRSAARAPAAPARTFRMRAVSPTACSIPHYVLDYEARFARGGDGCVRRQLSHRRDPGAVHRLQPEDQVPGSVWRRPRGSAPRRWRPAIMWRASPARAAGSSTAPPTRSATRAISCSPPRASSSASCASRSVGLDKDETRKLARDFGLADRGEVRQPGHLLRADRPLYAE